MTMTPGVARMNDNFLVSAVVPCIVTVAACGGVMSLDLCYERDMETRWIKKDESSAVRSA